MVNPVTGMKMTKTGKVQRLSTGAVWPFFVIIAYALLGWLGSTRAADGSQLLSSIGEKISQFTSSLPLVSGMTTGNHGQHNGVERIPEMVVTPTSLENDRPEIIEAFVQHDSDQQMNVNEEMAPSGGETYSPYAFDSVATAGNYPTPDPTLIRDYYPLLTGQGPDGRIHAMFLTRDSDYDYHFFYTHNSEPGAEQHWDLSLDEVNPTPDQDLPTRLQPLPIDATGRAHYVWLHLFPETGTTDLERWKNELEDLFYASGGPGGWGEETNVTNYEAVYMGSNDEYCNYDRREPRTRGVQWWAKPHVALEHVGVTPDGTPLFTWTKSWLFVPAATDGTERICWGGATGRPAPEWPVFDDTYHVFAMRGTGGLEQEIDLDRSSGVFSDAEGGSYILGLTHGGFDLAFSYAPPSGNWGSVQILSTDTYSIVPTFSYKIDRFNIAHVLMGSRYLRFQNGAVVGNEMVPYGAAQEGWTVSRDGQLFYLPFPFGTQIWSNINGEWRRIGTLQLPHATASLRGLFMSDEEDIVGIWETIDLESYSWWRGSTLITTATTRYNGGSNGGDTVGISDGAEVNLTNGDSVTSIPLFTTAGRGPQLSIALHYSGLGGVFESSEPQTGWQVSPVQKIFHSKIEFCSSGCVSNPPQSVWLRTPSGKTIVFEHIGGNVFRADDHSESQFLQLVQDETSRSWELEEADGTRHGFRTDGYIDWTEDPSGNRLEYVYDDSRLTQITDNQGRLTKFNYSGNLLIGITDPQGGTYTLDYYAPGEAGGGVAARVLKSAQRNATGQRWTFSYHQSTDTDETCADRESCQTKNAFLKTITNPRGHTQQFFYGAGGRVVKVRNASNEELTVDYENWTDGFESGCSYFSPDDGDLHATVTDWRGSQSAFDSDVTSGVIVRAVDPDGYSRIRQYYSHRTLVCEEDERGNVTEYEWGPPADPDDFVRVLLKEIHLPDTAEPIHYTYTAAHEIETVTDPLGNQTQYFYEDARNPHLRTKIIEPED